MSTSSVAVSVLRAPHLGCLSYVSDDIEVAAGDVVLVPFGDTTTSGVVVGPGNTTLATKRLVSVTGGWFDPKWVELVSWVASRWVAPDGYVWRRAAPDASALDLAVPSLTLPSVAPVRKYVSVPPSQLLADVALGEALQMSDTGQVLIVVPTKQQVSYLESQGVAVLDADTHVLWRTGHLRLAVSTRSSVLFQPAEAGAVVVADPEHPGHREPKQPYSTVPQIALRMSDVLGVSVVLVGRVPHVTMLHSGVKFVEPSGVSGWPDVLVLRPDRAALLAKRLEAASSVGVLMPDNAPQPRCLRCSHELVFTLPPYPPCERCGSGSRLSGGYGWDRFESRFARFADKVVHVPLSKLGVARFDVMVVPDPSRWMSSMTDAARLVMRAAAGGGSLVVFDVSDRSRLSPFLSTRRLRPLLVDDWVSAKRLGSAPFTHMVDIQVSPGRKPPTAGLPVPFAGPSKTAAGWAIRLRCAPDDLVQVHEWLLLARSDRFKVRVSVL